MIWRIRDRGTFVRLSRDGRRVRAGVLWCTYCLDPSLNPPQVAFAIGRAIGPAVVRNRTRRRLRALLWHAPLPPGAYLFGGRPGLGERSSSELARDVASLLATIDPSSPVPATRTTSTASEQTT